MQILTLGISNECENQTIQFIPHAYERHFVSINQVSRKTPQNLQSKEKQALSLFHKYMQTVTQYIFTVIEKIQEN